mmetsp:Transcript_35659/g.77834  ORF Transcript_35659/g.77834 Transcript_35659/m.77834 type:complete len:280 (-) Transcript_35659:468-1307(-)
MADEETESVVYICRHGDRWDFANPEWHDQMKELGYGTWDPSLSPLGHKQAREVGEYMKRTAVLDTILVSPYLRTIQTAIPTADAFGLQLNLEEGLAEVLHSPNWLPTAAERFKYFPQVNVGYSPLHAVEVTPGKVNRHTGMPREGFPEAYWRRLCAFAAKLEQEHIGKKVLCVSHAASVALVAAILRTPDLGSVGKMAPCGIFKLVKRGAGPWELEQKGASNEAYVSENSPTTFPWGFEEKDCALWASKLEDMLGGEATSANLTKNDMSDYDLTAQAKI